MSFVTLCFWTCAAMVAYTYVAYPIIIWAFSRCLARDRTPPSADPEHLPRISILVVANNEEDVIGQRIENALAMDYPQDRAEIVIGLDGCTDRTAEIVRGFAGRGVKLLEFSQRRGKASVLNDAMARLEGEVAILSDANTEIDRDAPRRLVRWFADPRVGVVCGRLELVDRLTGGNADGAYWKYENFLKRCEGRLGALLGANGAIYAIRRALYRPIRNETTNDDFEIPLLARLATGCDIVYDAEAVAHEETSPDIRSEFRRRVRIGASGFNCLASLRGLLDPRRGWIAFTFLSHKVLRWVCPFFLIGLLATNALLLDRPAYRASMAAQVGFYLLSLLVVLGPARLRLPKPVRLAGMFTSMNVAFLVGFWRWASGRHGGVWVRTSRIAAEGKHA